MIPLSILDLSPIVEGGAPAQSFRSSLDLARHGERWGYRRHWLAEHHNMPGIASAATSVLIGHIAAGTTTIRVGAGGIMLSNHAPLMIAEQFGTLACIYGDRIDLGIGRAPGTDLLTARALRRGMQEASQFPQDVAELIGYLGDPAPAQPVHAVPGAGTRVPVWILGSSLYGARLAAHFGLPYAFASHFAPAALADAVAVYRETFEPSEHLDRPRFMLAINAFAAETDAGGMRLMSSMQLSFARLRAGRPGPLPYPVDNVANHIDGGIRGAVDAALSCSVVGSPSSVADGLKELIGRYAPDEVIINGQIHDHAARLRSFGITADAMRAMDAVERVED